MSHTSAACLIIYRFTHWYVTNLNVFTLNYWVRTLNAWGLGPCMYKEEL